MLTSDNLKNKIVFFDFDGVLCTYQGSKEKVHVPPDDYLKIHIDSSINPYQYSRAPETIRKLVGELDGNNVFVLTQSDSSFEHRSKERFIGENYTTIPIENIISVASTDAKLTVMQGMYDTYFKDRYEKQDLVLIEDTVSTLFKVESAGFKGYHILSLME